MFGFSRKEQEADAVYIMLKLFMREFDSAIYREVSAAGERYSNWYGSGWDDRYIVVMSAYASAVKQQAGFSGESVSLGLKKYCMNEALSNRGEAMYHRTVDGNLLKHYEHLYSYVYELADVVRAIPGGSGGVKLGCAVDLNAVMSVFVEKYFKFTPLSAEFNCKSASRISY